MEKSKYSDKIDTLLAKGYNPKEIAKKLGIKPQAVHNRAYYNKKKAQKISQNYVIIKGVYKQRTFWEWLTNKPRELQEFKVLG